MFEPPPVLRLHIDSIIRSDTRIRDQLRVENTMFTLPVLSAQYNMLFCCFFIAPRSLFIPGSHATGGLPFYLFFARFLIFPSFVFLTFLPFSSLLWRLFPCKISSAGFVTTDQPTAPSRPIKSTKQASTQRTDEAVNFVLVDRLTN